MTRHNLLHFYIPISLYLLVGWWIGTQLIKIEFQTFKVLNIIGLTYDLLGIFILSQFIASNEKYRSIITEIITEQFCSFVVFAGTGFILFAQFGPQGPSKLRLEEFSINAFMFFILPTFMYVAHGVVGVEKKTSWSTDTKIKLFGGFFVVTGILIQLYAAILDLYS